MKKKFRRWLLRRRPVTEGVKRRNKGYGNFFVTNCKGSFKKIPKFRFFSHFFGKARKNGRSYPASVDNKTYVYGGSFVSGEIFLEGISGIPLDSEGEEPNPCSNPTILSLPSRTGGLRELPKFCKRFRLPTDSFGAHHRGTKIRTEKERFRQERQVPEHERSAFGVAGRGDDSYTSPF